MLAIFNLLSELEIALLSLAKETHKYPAIFKKELLCIRNLTGHCA